MEMFIKRFAAYMIDIFILTIFAIILEFICVKLNLFYPYTISLILYLIYISYFSLQEASFYQATIGKRIMNLVVCDKNGNKLSIWRAYLRNFARIINTICFSLGYVLIIFTKKHYAVHDFIARALVVNESDIYEEETSNDDDDLEKVSESEKQDEEQKSNSVSDKQKE